MAKVLYDVRSSAQSPMPNGSIPFNLNGFQALGMWNVGDGVFGLTKADPIFTQAKADALRTRLRNGEFPAVNPATGTRFLYSIDHEVMAGLAEVEADQDAYCAQIAWLCRIFFEEGRDCVAYAVPQQDCYAAMPWFRTGGNSWNSEVNNVDPKYGWLRGGPMPHYDKWMRGTWKATQAVKNFVVAWAPRLYVDLPGVADIGSLPYSIGGQLDRAIALAKEISVTDKVAVKPIIPFICLHTVPPAAVAWLSRNTVRIVANLCASRPEVSGMAIFMGDRKGVVIDQAGMDNYADTVAAASS